MNYLLFILIFLFGSAIGSFLNVVIWRLETGEDIVKKRSHCPKCGQVLAWYNLIPIISFFILRGRCRSCQEKISWQYPLVEAATGGLFVVVFQSPINNQQLTAQGLSPLLLFIVYCLLLISCLIVIFVYDLRHYIIPDKVIFPALGAALVYRVFEVLASFNPPIPPLNKAGGGV